MRKLTTHLLLAAVAAWGAQASFADDPPAGDEAAEERADGDRDRGDRARGRRGDRDRPAGARRGDRDAERPRPDAAFRGPLLEALDADGDREISAEEIENAATALKTLDENNDGKLTAEELRPAGGFARGEARDRPRPDGDRPIRADRDRPRPGGGRPERGFDAFLRFDEDGDEKISREELPEPMRDRFFQFADANEDGFVDREEMAEVRSRFRERGGEDGAPRRGRGDGDRGEGSGRPGAEDRPDRPE